MSDIFNYTPRNAQEAARLTRSYAKALECIAAGYTFSRDEEIGMTAVCKPGELHASYWICDRPELVAPHGGCSCPDYDKHPGTFCKHILAYQELQNQEAEAEEYFARMEELYSNAECATGCDPYSRY